MAIPVDISPINSELPFKIDCTQILPENRKPLIFMTSFFFSGVNAITSFYYTAPGRAYRIQMNEANAAKREANAIPATPIRSYVFCIFSSGRPASTAWVVFGFPVKSVCSQS